jgi:aspartate racemase
MGPHATVDFMSLLVRLTPAEKDWNHLHIIVDNNPRIPSRTRAILFAEASPSPYLVEGARRLVAAGAELIVVPCNSASHYLGPVREAVPVPVLDPVMATAAAVRRAGVRRPVVLGGMVTHRADLYGRALAPHAVAVERPTDPEQDEVAALIEALKRLDTSPAVVERTRRVIGAARARGADSAILGCTEFGLIAEVLGLDLPVFNSNELLARVTVDLARP